MDRRWPQERPWTHRLRASVPMLQVLLGQGALSAASFVTVWLLGRWGGADALGQYALGASVCFLTLSLADTLVTTPYTFHASQAEPFAPDGVMVAGWAMAALAGLAMLAWGAGWTAWGGSWTLGLTLPLAVAALMLRELFRRHWLVRQQHRALMVQDLLTAALQVGALTALARWGRPTAAWAFVSVAAGSLLPLLPTLLNRVRWQRAVQALPHVPGGMRLLVAYGRWLLVGGLLHVASLQAYPWLALASGGVKQAGLFAACNSLVNLISPLLTGLTNHDRPLFMQAARRPRPAFGAFVRQRLAGFVLPAAALWTAAQLAGPWVLERLYGGEFSQAGDALSWMALGTVAVAVAAPLQLALLALRAPASNPLHHGSAVVVLALLWCGAGGGGGGGWSVGGGAVGPPDITALGRWYALAQGLATVVLAGLFARRWVRD